LTANPLRRLMVCLTAAALVALFLVGALAGCGRAAVQEEGNGEADNGQADNGAEDVSGHAGIAFVRDDHVYVADADGSGERRLTSDAAGYGDLAFSPSGRKIAATRVEGDAMPQLVVMEVAGGEVTDVSWSNPDYSQAWTSEGVKPWFGGTGWVGEDILYCTGIINRNGHMTLLVLKFDLSGPRIEVIEENAQNPAVSVDGGQLAFIRKPDDWEKAQEKEWQAGDFGDLAIMDLESGDMTTIGFNVFDVSFSLDGGRLALTVFEEPDTALIVTDMEGGRLYTLRVIGPVGNIRHPSFSPAGEKIIACRHWREEPGEPYTNEIFVVPTDSDNVDTTELGKGEDPAWSPNWGSHL
jgi:dipeptidyl aminopeptidase/acylaminoacyl peptidase